MTTEEAVRSFLKKHMPIKEQNLTLLKLANRVKKEYPLTVKPKTIMSWIVKILQSDYNTTWDKLQTECLLKYGAECDIYLILSTGFSNGTYHHYYLKIGESVNWDKQRKNSYISHNPGVNIIKVQHYKGIFPPEFVERKVRGFIWCFMLGVKDEDIVDGTVEWVEISKEKYLYFEQHGGEILTESFNSLPKVVSEGEKENKLTIDDFDDIEKAKKYFRELLSKRDKEYQNVLMAYKEFHPEMNKEKITYYDMLEYDLVIEDSFSQRDKNN